MNTSPDQHNLIDWVVQTITSTAQTVIVLAVGWTVKLIRDVRHDLARLDKQLGETQVRVEEHDRQARERSKEADARMDRIQAAARRRHGDDEET